MLTNTWTEQLINYSPEKYKKNYASTHSQQINKSLPSGIFLLIEDIHTKSKRIYNWRLRRPKQGFWHW